MQVAVWHGVPAKAGVKCTPTGHSQNRGHSQRTKEDDSTGQQPRMGVTESEILVLAAKVPEREDGWDTPRRIEKYTP